MANQQKQGQTEAQIQVKNEQKLVGTKGKYEAGEIHQGGGVSKPKQGIQDLGSEQELLAVLTRLDSESSSEENNSDDFLIERGERTNFGR